jgi:hypothetical protein
MISIRFLAERLDILGRSLLVTARLQRIAIETVQGSGIDRSSRDHSAMSDESGPKRPRSKPLARFWDLASEHKLFSGFLGSLMVAAVALFIAFAANKNSNQTIVAGNPEAGHELTSEAEAPEAEATVDEDEDGVADSIDECLGESGEQPGGCPAASRDISLGEYLEAEEPESFSTENTTYGQSTVSGIIDPLGIRMELDNEYRSASLTVPTQGAFQAIHGQVGITSEPCSPGAVANVAIRDEEGAPLWPKTGRLQPVGRKPFAFDVPIKEEDVVVLFASAPAGEVDYCGIPDDTTMVGWIQTQLVAPAGQG